MERPAAPGPGGDEAAVAENDPSWRAGCCRARRRAYLLGLLLVERTAGRKGARGRWLLHKHPSPRAFPGPSRFPGTMIGARPRPGLRLGSAAATGLLGI